MALSGASLSSLVVASRLVPEAGVTAQPRAEWAAMQFGCTAADMPTSVDMLLTDQVVLQPTILLHDCSQQLVLKPTTISCTTAHPIPTSSNMVSNFASQSVDPTITGYTVRDLRFPTSLDSIGSDPMK